MGRVDVQKMSNLSALILKFQIVHGDNIPVLDPHLLQLIEQTRLAQNLIEVHPALIVGEIDVAHEPLEPRPLHQPGVVVPVDIQRGGGIHLRRRSVRSL